LLEPRIFEKFKGGKERGHTAEAICFGGTMPVFDDSDESSHQIGIRRLRSEKID